jgi:hypothetical protein
VPDVTYLVLLIAGFVALCAFAGYVVYRMFQG